MQVIAEHLYQQGNFTVGDTFVEEAGISNSAAIKKPYTAMHAVLKQVSRTALVCTQRWDRLAKVLDAQLTASLAIPALLADRWWATCCDSE